MENVVNFDEKLATDFSISVAQIKELSKAFYEDMCAKKTLQMLNTYMFFNISLEFVSHLPFSHKLNTPSKANRKLLWKVTSE